MDSLHTGQDLDRLTEDSIALAVQLISNAERQRSRRDRANRKRFARMINQQSAVQLTMMLTDRVIRIRNQQHSARALREATRYATVDGLGMVDFVGVRLATTVGKFLPWVVMPAVRWRVRRAAQGIILPGERPDLSEHISQRARSHAKLNVNVLGEAILGDQEAQRRCAAILEMMDRPEVDYVSVKISAVVSQINVFDHDGSVERVAHNLRQIYRSSMKNRTFVNLDMEEFKDLSITVDVFTKLLDELEFEHLSAGIVLQAYLPDSHAQLQRLIEWSRARHVRTGASIKIRAVKGANLAQEHTDTEIHGWNLAPFSTKAQVDASYLRMLDVLLRPENCESVRVGVASHNLFHLAWAMTVAKEREVQSQIDIEMLEGMANGEALAVTEHFGNVLLYSPVSYRHDFPSAVAYLVRRLDENTSPENYLTASFDMSTSGRQFDAQRERFVDAVRQRHDVDTASKRHAPLVVTDSSGFVNASDGDPTDARFRDEVGAQLDAMTSAHGLHIPLGVCDFTSDSEVEVEQGIDPSDNGNAWYTYEVATMSTVDHAVQQSRDVGPAWTGLATAQRSHLLFQAALIISQRRSALIALMARDGGKPILEADAEISEAIDFANYYAEQAKSLSPDSQELGTVLVVPPWNFPFAIPLGGVCAALAAGNCVILKPAPETVATAYEIAQILWSAGVPKNVLQFVPCRDDQVGQHLVTHPGIASVILTGSFETALMFKTWKPELNLMAETSGKNSIVISASADIDTAVKDLIASAFGHAGQKCSAASLAIVEASIYDSTIFRSQLKDAAQSLAFGPSTNRATTNGPIIRPPDGALLRALLHLEAGEEWLLEPRQLDSAGYLWSAGIKLGVQPGSWSHQNEWFGPVLGVMKFENFTQALKWQNSTSFGLTAGIASLDDSECSEWVATVEAGNLYVNRGITGAIVGRQPFGGWKQSSVGPTAKAGGPHYLEQLRHWEDVRESSKFIHEAERWLARHLMQPVPTSEMAAELNFSRLTPHLRGCIVRLNAETSPVQLDVVEWLSERADLCVTISQSESLDELLGRLTASPATVGKVRWLSSETPPHVAMLRLGMSIDVRSIADSVGVEMPRWLQEQSISITNHRYGNVGAAPQVSFS